MNGEVLPERIDLAYPLYLDVPMMTSFVAALEDGIAYGSDVTQRADQQRAISGQGEARAGMFGLGIVSSLLSLDLRGRISGEKTAGETEEVKLVRKHTEASLFMRLRHVLQNDNRIYHVQDVTDLENLRDSEQEYLVEIKGQISRSPLSDTLEGTFRVLDMLGIDLSGSRSKGAQSSPGGKARGGRGGKGHRNSAPQLEEFTSDQEFQFGVQLMQRLKDDLESSKVTDVVMRPAAAEELSVVIALTTEFLPEGSLDNLLSGVFTVIGKVTQIVEGDDEISLYRRTAFSYLGSSELNSTFEQLPDETGLQTAGGTMSIKAPALQIMPLAIHT
jgi:hypothetical protein